MPERVFVSSRVGLDGEQFCVIRPNAVPLFRIGSVTEIPDRIAKYAAQLEWLTEDDLRRQLTADGVSDEDIERQLSRSRALRGWVHQHVLERTTQIGHRNEHGQIVVAKTLMQGTKPFERIFILRCEGCGYEYGTDGCDIHARRCPACQDGGPGVTMRG